MATDGGPVTLNSYRMPPTSADAPRPTARAFAAREIMMLKLFAAATLGTVVLFVAIGPAAADKRRALGA